MIKAFTALLLTFNFWLVIIFAYFLVVLKCILAFDLDFFFLLLFDVPVHEVGSFTCGVWCESHDVLGVLDDADTLYFLKANGEEKSRVTLKQLKLSSPIIGLIPQDDPDGQGPCGCVVFHLIFRFLMFFFKYQNLPPFLSD